ncbi:MAG TPA: hypothetical protein VN688_07565 [Gemmataceae bacterium]|nr:hypothetical protein [Gemmataceae bacterium]
MTQRSLWDYAEDKRGQQQCPAEEDEQAQRDDRERSRRQTFRRLRASGHWLTLLRVARSIPQPFTLNDLSVAVWKVCPEFFGMKGYSYPDNHRVHYILYGNRGLIAKGILQRVRQGLFQVPDLSDLEELLRSNLEAETEELSTDSPDGQRRDENP